MLPVIGRLYQGPTRHESSGRGVRNSELLRLLPHRTVYMIACVLAGRYLVFSSNNKTEEVASAG